MIDEHVVLAHSNTLDFKNKELVRLEEQISYSTKRKCIISVYFLTQMQLKFHKDMLEDPV